MYRKAVFVFIIYLHDSYVLCDFKVRSDQNMSDKSVLLSGGGLVSSGEERGVGFLCSIGYKNLKCNLILHKM